MLWWSKTRVVLSWKLARTWRFGLWGSLNQVYLSLISTTLDWGNQGSSCGLCTSEGPFLDLLQLCSSLWSLWAWGHAHLYGIHGTLGSPVRMVPNWLPRPAEALDYSIHLESVSPTSVYTSGSNEWPKRFVCRDVDRSWCWTQDVYIDTCEPILVLDGA